MLFSGQLGESGNAHREWVIHVTIKTDAERSEEEDEEKTLTKLTINQTNAIG